jgi:hypothetical protein
MRWQRADIVVDPHIGDVILARWYLQILNQGVERHCVGSVTGERTDMAMKCKGRSKELIYSQFSKVSKDSIMAVPAPGPTTDSCICISYRLGILCLSGSRLTSQTGIWIYHETLYMVVDLQSHVSRPSDTRR